jgi:DNA-binding XRE family transcriptional regulator
MNSTVNNLIKEGKLIRSGDIYNALPEDRRKNIESKVEALSMLYKIREAREKAGFTQKELAEKSGVPQATISKIESGKRNLELNTLNKIAKAMGKRIEINFC